MITIVAKAIVKEGKREAFIQAIQAMIEGSRAEEGNISYNLFEDLDNENVLTFMEQWKSMEAIDFHNRTPHFQSGVAAIGDLMESMEITKYQALK
ncbi:MAG: antibiotic biosynthesis monooxygenase [Bacteroides sp.]|nr:antibiotic biosynthesis monooxygenase [Bacteroides sp.]